MSPIITLTPSGRLRVEAGADGQRTISEATADALRRAFERSNAEGLLLFATTEMDQELPAEFTFWRGIVRGFFQRLGQFNEAASKHWETLSEPPTEELEQWVAGAPPMRGLEYLTADRLGGWWRELRDVAVARVIRGLTNRLLSTTGPKPPTEKQEVEPPGPAETKTNGPPDES